jgi:hypothetical protein
VPYHRGDRSRFEVNLTRNSSSPQRSEPLMRVLADKPG